MNPLSEYHNDTVRVLRANEDNPNLSSSAALRYDAANEIAIELITKAGYEFGDLDAAEVNIEEDVQTLLELAMFRAPKLMQLLDTILQA